MLWQIWWVWIAGGFLLALAELVIPGYVFVGTAAGAVVTGLVLWTGLPPAGWLAASLGNSLLFLGIVSIALWLLLRRILGIRKGQIRIWDRDINED